MSEKLFSPRGEALRQNREFVDTIQHFRRRIDRAERLDKLVSAMLIGAGMGLLFQAVSFVLPFYYVNLCTVLSIILAICAAFAAAWMRKCSMERAALVMDSFGFQERIVTAYENLGEEGEMARRQREDAALRLREQRGRIQIPLWPDRRKTGGLVAILLILPVLAFLPSGAKEHARELHLLKQEAKAKEEEIKAVLDDVKKLEESGMQDLTEEQLAKLQEMTDSLRASLTEYQQAASAEDLAAAQTKLNFKYKNMGEQLARLAESLPSKAAASSVNASALREMAEKMQNMSGTASPGGSDMLASSESGTEKGDGAGDGTGKSDGAGDGTGKSDGAGDGTGKGDGAGNGAGGDSGNPGGGGDGEKDGQGSDGASGSGKGSGSGRGEGSSSARHDYISVPNAIADTGNLTGNATEHENSEFFREQNGLGWEGVHVSHDAVIGSYRERAYEGIAAGQYPEGMENVIKEYFSSFNL